MTPLRSTALCACRPISEIVCRSSSSRRMARAIASAVSAWLSSAVSEVSTSMVSAISSGRGSGSARRGVGDSGGRRRRPGVSRAGCPGIRCGFDLGQSRRTQRMRPAARLLAHPSHQRPSLPAGEAMAIRRSWRQGRVRAPHRYRGGSRVRIIVGWLTVARVARKSKAARGAEFRAWPPRRTAVGTALHHTLPMIPVMLHAAARGRPIAPHGTSRFAGREHADAPIGLAGTRRRCDNPTSDGARPRARPALRRRDSRREGAPRGERPVE